MESVSFSGFEFDLGLGVWDGIGFWASFGGGEDFRRQGITSICLPIPSYSEVVLSIYKAKALQQPLQKAMLRACLCLKSPIQIPPP